mmetsp:Transcript_19392/g.42938  ORF Transcript_19392/g.42938 Transcript_19392/m.42938 type:complete len:125 (+) Transcript_19392:525-899(+)
MLNGPGMQATNKKFKMQLEEVPTLFLEFQGDNVDQLMEDARNTEQMAKKHGCTGYTLAEEGSKIDDLWEARRGCLPGVLRGPGPEPPLGFTDGASSQRRIGTTARRLTTCTPGTAAFLCQVCRT